MNLPPGVPSTCTIRNRYLDRKHQHPRDRRVFFDIVPHSYFCDFGDGNFTSEHTKSVTSIIGAFFDEFDGEKIITKMMGGKNWLNNAKYQLSKGPPVIMMTREQIKEAWASNGLEARTAGSAIHDWIDHYYNGECSLEDIKDDEIELKYFSQFVKEIHSENISHLTPYRSEWFIFSDDDTRIPGAIDMLYVNDQVMHMEWCKAKRNGTEPTVLHVVIYDWKRSKEIKKYNPWEKGYHPCGSMPNTNYFHYSLQLNLYRYILETYYHGLVYNGKTYDSIRVDFMFLCILHPRRKTFNRFRVPDYQDEVKEMVGLRRESLRRIRMGQTEVFPFDKSQPAPESTPECQDEYDFGQE
jgi:hypothetical protein